MGAVNSVTNELIYMLSPGYFNSEKYIFLVSKILAHHPDRNITMFIDGGSLHTSKKSVAWMHSQPRLKWIMNVEYEPENMGIETLWNLTKLAYRKRLTDEKLKTPIDFDTFQCVRDVLESLTA